MNSIINTINNISNTVMDTISPAPASEMDLTKRQVLGLEEAERTRRMEHPADALQSQQTAAQVSSFMKNAKLPTLNSGIKRVTGRAEEMERSRRISSKPEVAHRKMNAGRSANMIRSLGWPFYMQNAGSGPVYAFADETSIAEEQERSYRLNNVLQAQQTKQNAARTANAIRWGLPSLTLLPHKGSRAITRGMQERERSRIVNDQEELFRASELAYRTAGCIRSLGWPFYVSGEHFNVNAMEDVERSRRIADKGEQALAREHANRVSRLIPRTVAHTPARKNSSVQQLSSERPQQISNDRLEELLSPDVWKQHEGLHGERSDTNWAYEQERDRRIRDPYGSAIAKRNATLVSNIIFMAKPRSLGSDVEKQLPVFEQERQSRMHDRQQQLTSQRNARLVSNLIKDSHRPSSIKPAKWSRLMEQEKNRRMVDPQQSHNVKLAKQVSDLVLNRQQPFPSSFSAPQASLRKSLPFANELVNQPPTLKHATVAPHRALPFASELVNNRPALHSRPVLQRAESVPSMVTPHSAPVFEHEAMHPAPIATSVPLVQTGPLSQTSTFLPPSSVYTKPLPTTPAVAASPSGLNRVPFISKVMPLLRSRSTSSMVTSSPAAPVAGYGFAMAPLAEPIYAPNVYSSTPVGTGIPEATYFSAAGSHVLSNRQIKRLQHQADRHDRHSQKEIARANRAAAKAEKLHMRGKDSRAAKAETKVAEHSIAAKNHQQWANELIAKQTAPTITAAPSVVGWAGL